LEIESRQFGVIHIDEEKVITMPAGMPGFPGCKRFVLLEKEETRPFYWYQCVDDPGLTLVIMNPLLFKPDYSIDIGPAQRDMSWKEGEEKDYKVYVIVNASEGVPEKITANLIGPLVINTKRQEAVQMVISNSPHSHRFPIFQSAG
jgi:flagellar assembly factor FliW